jgi:hypothetical protein
VALTAQQKAQLRQDHPDCYVCLELGVADSSLAGYENRWIQYDHWQPQGLIGAAQATMLENMRPIHAAPGGLSPLDPGWDTSVRRNCHRGKSNTFTGSEWVSYIKIAHLAAKASYSDDLMQDRDQSDSAYDVHIRWSGDGQSAEMLGRQHAVMTQRVGPTQEEWRSIASIVNPRLLWVDEKVQSRAASPTRLAQFAWHLRENPLLSPILCRWSDNRLKVFDGNHRLCAFILARQDHPVPVTIFDGPDPERFLNVAAEAHDTLTQLKYQYTDKALKFSALHADELESVQERYGDQASEELAWRGMRPADVRLRIVGRLTLRLDQAGEWRLKWRGLGLTDPSWNQFLETYAKVTPEAAPFASPQYLREEEFENLSFLCQAFDEGLFDTDQARDSLKTKWWKRSHARFARALSQVVKNSLHLDNTPDKPTYAPTWDQWVHTEIRKAVDNWRESPAWRDDTAANNEADIDRILTQRGFTETALFG